MKTYLMNEQMSEFIHSASGEKRLSYSYKQQPHVGD